MADVYLTLQNGQTYQVMDGDLYLPFIGNYSAYLSFADADNTPEGKATLYWFGTSFVGYILRAGENAKRYSALFVGGNGGLWTKLSSKMYDYRIKLSLPLTEALHAAGENLSTLSTQSILQYDLPNWIRTNARLDELLNSLADQASAIWRMQPDGTVFFGTPAWTSAQNFEFSLQWQDPTWSSATFISTSCKLFPGTTFPSGAGLSAIPNISGRKISCVRYECTPEHTYMQCWFADDNIIDDPLHAGLATFVRQTMQGVDFFKPYSGKVILQRSDGTLDVRPDNVLLPPLTSVPIDVPVSGTKIKVNANDLVRIEFKDGDPTRYVVTGFVSGSGGRLLARKDGEVDGGSITITVGGMATISGSYTDGFGTTITQPGPVSITFAIKGKIKDGWTRWEVTSE